MPLRDDLLDPIAGENPSGPDLRYDPVFDQIKEARREEDDTLPTGDWDRPAKKADHRQVVKLAGESLAKRTKNLRLAASLVEPQFKLDGLAVLAPSIEFLRKLQENFWETLYPEIDEGDLQLRVNEIERAARQLALNLGQLPLTTNGLTPEDYRESRLVDTRPTQPLTTARKPARRRSKRRSRLPKEFDRAAAAHRRRSWQKPGSRWTKAINTDTTLDRFQRELRRLIYPDLSSPVTALQEAGGVIHVLLGERRKIEPDPVATFEKMAQWQPESGIALRS